MKTGYRIIASVLIILILVFSSKASFTMHYCGGEVSSVSLSGTPHSCGMEATNDISCQIQGIQQNAAEENLGMESCCLTLSYFTQNIPAALVTEKTVSLTTLFFALPVSILSAGLYDTPVAHKQQITHLKIPLSERSIILFVQSFLL
ncbi:MAG TPA: hypothetical protein VE870_09515 [Bacteroidales bacterium]|nr:hypothetical protein [Bacteroidales bacterium]